jgi:hypothetical protein
MKSPWIIKKIKKMLKGRRKIISNQNLDYEARQTPRNG